jgi:hypothetical protein
MESVQNRGFLPENPSEFLHPHANATPHGMTFHEDSTVTVFKQDSDHFIRFDVKNRRWKAVHVSQIAEDAKILGSTFFRDPIHPNGEFISYATGSMSDSEAVFGTLFHDGRKNSFLPSLRIAKSMQAHMVRPI